MSQPILVVVDPRLDASQPAIEKGLRLSRATGRPLHLFVNTRDRSLETAATLSSPGSLERAIGYLMNRWQKHLDTLLEQLGAADASVHIFWERHAEDLLARLVTHLSPALLVIHAERASGMRKLLLTPLHWVLMRQAPCPVLCVSADAWSDKVPVSVAIDLDPEHAELDARLLKTGSEFATCLGSTPDVVNVVEYPDETLVMLAGDAMPVSLDVGNMRQFYQQRLKEFADQHRISAAHISLLEGAAPEQLCQHAAHHGGILVMGSINHGLLRRLVLGNTAERVLQKLETDVLVVKPADFVSPWAELPPLEQRHSG